MLIYKALSVYAPALAVRLEGVQQLSVDTISSNRVRVRWTGVAGARGNRVVWGPLTGQQIFEEVLFKKIFLHGDKVMNHPMMSVNALGRV